MVPLSGILSSSCLWQFIKPCVEEGLCSRSSQRSVHNMQQQKRSGQVTGMKWRHSLVLSKTSLLLLLGSAFLCAGMISFGRLLSLSPLTAVFQPATAATNGATRWVGDMQITPASFDFPASSGRAV